MIENGYKNLHVWREAVAFIPDAHALTRALAKDHGPLAEEIFSAAVSIPAQIAEGGALQGRRAFLERLYAARGGLARLHTLLIVAEQLGTLSPAALESLERGLDGIAAPLQGLIGKVRDDAERWRPSSKNYL